MQRGFYGPCLARMCCGCQRSYRRSSNYTNSWIICWLSAIIGRHNVQFTILSTRLERFPLEATLNVWPGGWMRHIDDALISFSVPQESDGKYKWMESRRPEVGKRQRFFYFSPTTLPFSRTWFRFIMAPRNGRYKYRRILTHHYQCPATCYRDIICLQQKIHKQSLIVQK